MKILVTGGASGLGEAIVKTLVKNNEHKVLFTYNKSVDKALAITKQFPNTVAIPCNFGDPESIQALLNRIAEEDIDILVNNAIDGMAKDHFQKIDPSIFLNSFERNVLPTLKITQEAIKVFRKKKFGKIITIISSANINKPPVGWSEYVANKAYLLSMSKSWATENIRFNITSNAISPAFMLTSLTADTDERVLEQMKENHPLKTLLNADEVADAVMFFANSTQQINGVNLAINAGESLL